MEKVAAAIAVVCLANAISCLSKGNSSFATAISRLSRSKTPFANANASLSINNSSSSNSNCHFVITFSSRSANKTSFSNLIKANFINNLNHADNHRCPEFATSGHFCSYIYFFLLIKLQRLGSCLHQTFAIDCFAKHQMFAKTFRFAFTSLFIYLTRSLRRIRLKFPSHIIASTLATIQLKQRNQS